MSFYRRYNGFGRGIGPPGSTDPTVTIPFAEANGTPVAVNVATGTPMAFTQVGIKAVPPQARQAIVFQPPLPAIGPGQGETNYSSNSIEVAPPTWMDEATLIRGLKNRLVVYGGAGVLGAVAIGLFLWKRK